MRSMYLSRAPTRLISCKELHQAGISVRGRLVHTRCTRLVGGTGNLGGPKAQIGSGLDHLQMSSRIVCHHL